MSMSVVQAKAMERMNEGRVFEGVGQVKVPGKGAKRGLQASGARFHASSDGVHISHRDRYNFSRKTTYSNRRFDIIDYNKWIILYIF